VVAGVQSCTYGFELARTDVNAFGKLSAYDRVLTTTPTVSTELQYLCSSNNNVPTKAEIMSNTADTGQRNVFIGLAGHSTDADYSAAGNKITTKGNFISAATAEASVGAFALHTVGWEGTGMTSAAGSVGTPSTAVAAKAQEHVAAAISLYSVTGVAQSANMTANITREILEKFGRRYSDQRLIQFPASASLTIEGLDTHNQVDFTTLSSYSEATANVRTSPSFVIDGKSYGLVGAIADSVTFNGGIGDNHTVSMVFSTSIGEVSDTVHNFNWHA
jgi:hypothetical protein